MFSSNRIRAWQPQTYPVRRIVAGREHKRISQQPFEP